MSNKPQNIIPMGFQCFTAQALVYLGLRNQSLPFDYLRSPLNKLITIIDDLKYSKLDLTEFLSANSMGYNNKGIFIGHFVTIPDNEYGTTKEYIYRATKETTEKFVRRFQRFKEYFFEGENILLYNDFGVKDSSLNNFVEYFQPLKDFNKKNQIVIITYNDRQAYDLLSNIANVHKINLGVETAALHKARDEMHELLKNIL